MIQLNIPTVENINPVLTAISSILFILAILGFVFATWLYFRNNKVLDFRLKVNGLSYRLAIYFLERGNFEMVVASRMLHEILPSYWKMLYSFRPLELEEYFDLDTYADGEIKRAMQQINADLPGAENLWVAVVESEQWCPRCNGTGNELASMHGTCEACDGSGIRNADYNYGE